MSGLLALLDDVAGIVKIAAASVDDVVGQAVKVGAKTAGAVIDDAAVSPKYVQGFSPARELPIVGRIALGSIRNKLLILLPAALLLANFAPFMIAPLLMLGGAYLCFEGAEKIAHWLWPNTAHAQAQTGGDPGHLEEEKISGAIKTDFILSAEIMTIALASIPESGFWMEAATLVVVAIGITVAVYGSVALIVKADDFGLLLCRKGRFGLTRAFGRALVRLMPGFLVLLMVVGTAAMLWVGGSIFIHGLEELGFGWLGHSIHDLAVAVAHRVGQAMAVVEWGVTAALSGVLGLAFGFVMIPVGNYVVTPVWGLFSRKKMAPEKIAPKK